MGKDDGTQDDFKEVTGQDQLSPTHKFKKGRMSKAFEAALDAVENMNKKDQN